MITRKPIRNLGLALAALLLASLAPGSARADGGFFYPPYWILYENSQTAMIHHAEGIEDLRILPGFHGDAHDFAWIVPVPSVPTLATADLDLFQQLEDMTRALYVHRDSNWGCTEESWDVVAGIDDGVSILDEDQVGVYRTMIIAADDGAALFDSLSTWGYLHSGNTDRVTEVLQSYVDRQWVFVTMKVDESVLEDGYPYLPDYWYGQLQPIHLRFASEEPVYPLHISSLSAAQSSQVGLYVVADHRMALAGAETWYANRIDSSERTAIGRRYPSVGEVLETGDFVTKLVRNYTPSQMDEDVVLVRADNDLEYRPVNYGGIPLFSGLLILSVAGWLAWKAIRLRRKREA